jgi:phospho-N-acetylmuramoyl-pentapeptide-transferase
MLRMILALIISVAGVLIIGPRVIPILRKLKFGQTIYELGPQTHKTKQGTPTMGGVMLVTVGIVAALVCHPKAFYGVDDFMLALCLLSFLTMLVGFADDYIKVVKKRSLGLTPMQKIIGQVLISVAFSIYCYYHPMVGSRVMIPFFNVEWDLGIFYIPLMTLLVIFMTNSANLQDGVDGILSTVTAIGSVAWSVASLLTLAALTVVSPMQNDNYFSIAVFAMALTGVCIGFLRFNRYPAQIFMGDTGSMFIGGATVGMAMLLRQPFLLLLIAFTMVASSLSVIIQRIYFKLTHGKRIFKMSPIHHHFELSGMTEKQVVLMYAIVTAVLAFVALLGMNLFAF